MSDKNNNNYDRGFLSIAIKALLSVAIIISFAVVGNHIYTEYFKQPELRIYNKKKYTNNKKVISPRKINYKYLNKRLNKKPINSKKQKENIYSWTDENGIKHFSNHSIGDNVTNLEVKQFDKIPESNITKVIIRNNKIFVPIKITNGFRNINTYLKLDTGATSTTLHKSIAKELSVNSFKPSTARIANGSRVNTYLANLDSFSIGQNTFSNFNVMFMDYQGTPDLNRGLLGMDILKKFNYKIDYIKKTILWNAY